MQTLQIFSIYDKKASAYMPPFCFVQKGQALRAFEDTVNDPQSQINKHPEDFVLYHLGEFADGSGLIKSFNPVHLEEAQNLKKISK